MSDSADPLETAAETASGVLAMLVLVFSLVTALVGLWAAVAATVTATVLGGAVFGLVYFISEGRADETDDVESVDGETDVALQRLRERYASGELSEDAFEDRLDALLATETKTKARRRVESSDTAAQANREVERSIE